MRDKLPKRIAVTPQERQRLLKVGKVLGEAVKELITIVSPRTFTRWLSGETGTVPAECSPLRAEDDVCEERLGGLLKHFRQRTG